MAHTLQIVYGSTTIDITSGDYTLLEYVPKAGKGGVVTERIRLFIKSSSAANFQTAVEDIELAIRQAEDRFDNGIGDKVYIKFQPDSLGTLYRSELVRLKPGFDAGRVDGPKRLLGAIWANKSGNFLFTFTRRDFWEANAETELSLSNGGGSGTGGQTIYNPHTSVVFSGITVSFTAPSTIADSGSGFGIFAVGDVISLRGSTINDGVYTVATASAASITVNEAVANEGAGDSVSIYDIQNYVDIAAASIDGVLDTPIRLSIVNETAGVEHEQYWVSVNKRTNPIRFIHHYEVEDSVTGSNTANAGASSGFYRQYAIATSEAKETYWVISQDQATQAFHGYYKILARFFDTTDITNCKYKLTLDFYGTTVFWDSGWFQFDDTYEAQARIIREFVSIRIPPYKIESLNSDAFRLNLWVESVTGSAETINLDFIELLPLDGWRKFTCLDGMPQNWELVDDGIDENTYRISATYAINDLVVEGDYIYLTPGVDHRVFFLSHGESSAAAINDELTASIFYRPRIRTF